MLSLLRALVVVPLVALATGVVHAQPVAPPAGLDQQVGRVMRAFDVPGLALAIVKDGEVVVARGYGVRTLGQSAPVTASTRFGIASNTKAFTGTALGLLVEDGAIEWDAPVVGYLPWFQMWDPWVTREITVRDLLVHRSGLGLGAGDLLWWPAATHSRREVARRLRFLPPATSFRSAYAYDNVLYIVAGELIEEVSGQSWEQFVESRILAKAGMSGSTTRHSDVGKGGDVAAPHARVDGAVRPVSPFLSDVTNAAGGINSNADGTRLFSERTARELTTVVTPIPVSEPAAELSPGRATFVGYGLGFGIRDYRGRTMVTHTGGLPGYVSRVTMIPEAGLGVAVLTNQESSHAFDTLTNAIVDHYTSAPPYDWLKAYVAVRDRADAAAAGKARAAAAARDASSRPSLSPSGYAGTYRDAWYGDVRIAVEDGTLAIRFAHTPVLAGRLEHWQHDTFVARWHDRELRADAFVTFALNPDGSIDQVKMRAVSEETDFSFDFHDLLLKPVMP
jgi:CubicO group peptidase (beta-lactamase class C family)